MHGFDSTWKKEKKSESFFPRLRFRLVSVFGSHAYFFFREKKVVGKDGLKEFYFYYNLDQSFNLLSL